MLHSSIFDTLGKTPLVKCSKLKQYFKLKGDIYGKVEFFNPTFSKKDRIAYYIIKKARDSGILKNKQPVVEATSGNTGMALAAVCAYLGHPFYAVISEGNSIERIKIMEMYGANLIIMKQEDGSYGKVSGNDFDKNICEAKRLSEELGAYYVNQFGNPWNIEAQTIMAEELYEDIIDNNLNIGIFCDFLGTGGSYQAISSLFLEKIEGIECNIVEPADSCPFYTLKKTVKEENQNNQYNPKPHMIQGGGYGKTDFPVMKNIRFHNSVLITDDEVKTMVKIIAEEEGIFCSYSSAANCLATIKMMEKSDIDGKPKNGLFIFCDTGLKYLQGIVPIP